MSTETRTNLCGVLYGKGDVRLEERSFSCTPGRGEVALSIQSVGICGSDLHFYNNGRIGDFILNEPVVLGHEVSAIVLAVGEGVVSLVPGDRVALEPGVACKMCMHCKSGSYHLCPYVRFFSCPPADGGYTQYFIHPADHCFKLPDNISLDEGALVEPLSVAVYACERARIGLGNSVLISGAGPIALLCTIAAKAFGASKILVTGTRPERLELAKQLGATHTLLVSGAKDPMIVADEVKDALGEQPNKTLECSGTESGISAGIYATLAGGVVALVGLGEAKISLPIVNACVREVDIVGVFRYCNTYPKTIELLASGRVNVKPLITHHFELKDIKTAFDTVKTRKDGAVKVIVKCN